MSEQFEKMTVVELRKAAKEMGVKLGAGISKQGIIEKLTAVAALSAPAAEAEKPAAHPVRSAAIITDDETEDDEDDIPVLTPNPALQPPSRPSAAPAPSASQGASSLSTISSKAPAFTMEGSRAWHNPRAYQGSSYQRPQSWAGRSAQTAGVDQRSSTTYRMAQQRPDSLRAPQTQAHPAPAYTPRFGPDQSALEGEQPMMDYHQASYNQPSSPAFSQPQDYSPRQDYQPTREAAPSMAGGAYPRSPQSGYYHKDLNTANPAVPEMLATGECGDGEGVLELHPDGYGFLRADNYLPGKNDVYISNAQIRRFSLRNGDYIVGKTRPQRETDRYCAMLYITEINGHSADETVTRTAFEDLTPIYPKKKINLSARGEKDPTLRLIDLLSPIGFGQRAMIVAPPKAGKTTVLKKIAASIARNHPKAHLMVLLVDERPEEVTDMKESVKGEVVYSTFDEPPENHVRVTELALERALRLVEQKKDVVILTDSLTRMVRAYNAIAPQTARVMTGGLAAGAMNKPKRFFGAARNSKEGGTLTIIATALVDTGSKMDDVIFEEFKGTGNMELALDRALADKHMFPAINILRSGTRHDELLSSEKELSVARKIRQLLSSLEPAQAMEQLLSMLDKTETNEELVEKYDSWMGMQESFLQR